MFPLGVLMIGTCIPFFDRKIRRWGDKLESEIQASQTKDATRPQVPDWDDKLEPQVHAPKQTNSDFSVDQLNPKQARRRARKANSRRRR